MSTDVQGPPGAHVRATNILTMVMSRAQTAPSGCNETRKYKVTLAITNANNSRVNIPIAKVDGYHMDWFECRDGAWYCKNRHGRVTLDNSNGARDRLTFHYDQVKLVAFWPQDLCRTSREDSNWFVFCHPLFQDQSHNLISTPHTRRCTDTCQTGSRTTG